MKNCGYCKFFVRTLLGCYCSNETALVWLRNYESRTFCGYPFFGMASRSADNAACPMIEEAK